MMRVYDTRAQAVVPLEVDSTVKIYTCGITPYDSAHMGHAAVYTAFDVLTRRLRDMGKDVRLVRNVTDVDDDILRKARELGVHYLDLATGEVAKFQKDMAYLGLLTPAVEPRATSAIPEILTIVSDLVEKGNGYVVDGWVYFDITTTPRFGELSHLDQSEMIALAAERGGHPEDTRRRHPLDFVLWQPSADGEPRWESRFGPGRPGWHIECCALACRELGTPVDIHGGGEDLIFPHHECEIVQAEAMSGSLFTKYWMHVGMVRLNGVKMSKSLGNLVFVDDLVDRYPGGAIRLALLAHHYRSSWDWTEEGMRQAAVRYESWHKAGEGDAGLGEVRAALDDDLDTPRALAVIDSYVKLGQGVSESARLLGVGGQEW